MPCSTFLCQHQTRQKAARTPSWRLAALFLLSAHQAAAQDLATQPFAENSPWNTKLAAGTRFLPNTAPATQELLAGNALIHAGTWSLPVFTARETDPWVSVHDAENRRDFQAQIPATARPDPMGDAHLIIIDPSHLHSLEMYHAVIEPGGHILARRAFLIDLRGPGMFLRDGRFPGIRAMDASGLGGLIRKADLEEGRIAHALTFLLPYSRLKHGPVWPSAREDFWGFRDYHGHIPIGTRIAIPRSVHLETLKLSRAGLMFARALQEYGAFCDDSVGSDAIVVSAEAATEGTQALAAMRQDFPVLHPYLRIVSP